MVWGRRAAFARSVSVNTRLRKRSPNRSTEAWIRSMLHRSEPIPTITRSAPARGGGPRREAAWWGGGGARRQAPSTSLRLVPLPVPGRISSSRLIHQCPHPPDAILQPGEDRLADQEMADVELNQLGDG